MYNQTQHLMYANPANQRRGIALMFVMVAILVTGGMALAYFGSRDNSIAISSNIEASTRSRAVAESGLDLAIAILETDSDWRTNHVEGVLLSNFAIGGGTITLTLMDSDTTLPPSESTMNVDITVRANVDELIQSAKANATITPYEGSFDVDFSEFAIFAQSRNEIDGAASLMHWSASPFSFQEQSLLIGTLATNPMSVIINSSNQQSVMELYTTSGASSMVSTSSMTVQEFAEAPPFLHSPPAPTSEFCLFENEFDDDDNDGNEDDDGDVNDDDDDDHNCHSPQNQNANSNSGLHAEQFDVAAGTYVIDNLSLLPGETLAIHGDVTITITGDLVLRHAAILVDDDASLTIHIGGNVSVVTSYLGNVNQTTQSYMDPSHLQLFGHNQTQWVFSGLTTIKGEVYAPQSEVEARGQTTICGRIAADEVTLRGAARLLYDPTLDHGGYADFGSSLYNESGELHPELFQLATLDPFLINEIMLLISMLNDGPENQYVNDWLSNPTDRIHDVLYALLVYGVDAHDWETLASELRWESDKNILSAVQR
jgi:Tfp pilus assembly protein PilX